MLEAHNVEPSPLQAAMLAIAGGADSITIHVRGDRRHIQEADAFAIKQAIAVPLNLEMGNTPEMLELALRLQPTYVCMVPETRQEITTEGGLDAVTHYAELKQPLQVLARAGIKVSLFIDPDSDQVEAAARLGVPMVELHTGAFANAMGDVRHIELARLANAAEVAQLLGLQVNAGHGINYDNVQQLLRIVPHLHELNIGHTIVSRALWVGMEAAVREMKDLMPCK